MEAIASRLEAIAISNKKLLGWRPLLLGARMLLGWRPSPVVTRSLSDGAALEIGLFAP